MRLKSSILALALLIAALASTAVYAVPSGTTPPPPPEDETVRTAADVVKSLTLTVAPANYSGPFPVTVRFRGAIEVTGKCSLYYNWLRSDKPSTPAHRVNFNGPGTKTVVSDLILKRPTQGWGTLFVWLASQGSTPKDVMYSNRANYKAARPPAGTATDEPAVHSATKVATDLPPVSRIVPEVKAVVTANPAESPGPPPVDVTFTAVIKTTGPCVVKYMWVIDNKASLVEKSIAFASAGEKRVTELHRVNRPWKGSAQLRISVPRNYESNKAQFMVGDGS